MASPCLVPSCLMGFYVTTLLRCTPGWQEVLPRLVLRVGGFARCVNVVGAGRRDRLVFGVVVLARSLKP